MNAVVAATCKCGSMLPEVVMCPDHHRYFRSGKELISVSKIIRNCWPVKKDFEAAPPDVLEHARERGIRIDAYFTEFLKNGRLRIPAGEWREVIVGVQAVIEWWRGEGFTEAESQVILAGDDIAGTCDVLTGNTVIDLKVVSALDTTYDIQIGAYVDLATTVVLKEGILLHCKIDAREMTAKVKPVPVDIKQARTDWRAMRDVWRIAQRRNPKKVAAQST